MAVSILPAKRVSLSPGGFVFLPAAGYRNGFDGSTIISNVGSNGYYWSSTPYDSIFAYRQYFTSGYVYPANDLNRYNAYAIRLVTESKQ